MSSVWLKQHVWVMNVVVASIAFYHYTRSGHHKLKLTMPFIIASIPMALIGGMLTIDGNLYDLLLSITLVWASYKVINFSSQKIVIIHYQVLLNHIYGVVVLVFLVD
jgi:uncharacterized membrane protein YfcA